MKIWHLYFVHQRFCCSLLSVLLLYWGIFYMVAVKLVLLVGTTSEYPATNLHIISSQCFRPRKTEIGRILLGICKVVAGYSEVQPPCLTVFVFQSDSHIIHVNLRCFIYSFSWYSSSGLSNLHKKANNDPRISYYCRRTLCSFNRTRGKCNLSILIVTIRELTILMKQWMAE